MERGAGMVLGKSTSTCFKGGRNMGCSERLDLCFPFGTPLSAGLLRISVASGD